MAEKQLTRNERDEIKSVILSKYKTEIQIQTQNSPAWKSEVEEQSRKLAIGKLGIEKLLVEIEKIEQTMEKLEAEKTQLEEKLSAKLPYKESSYHGSCRTRMSTCEAIEELMQETKTSAMSRHPVGKEVLRLERERDERLIALESCVFRSEAVSSGCFD